MCPAIGGGCQSRFQFWSKRGTTPRFQCIAASFTSLALVVGRHRWVWWYMVRFQIGSGFPYDAISDFPMMRFQISL
jgi:hypothetical protein